MLVHSTHVERAGHENGIDSVLGFVVQELDVT